MSCSMIIPLWLLHTLQARRDNHGPYAQQCTGTQLQDILHRQSNVFRPERNLCKHSTLLGSGILGIDSGVKGVNIIVCVITILGCREGANDDFPLFAERGTQTAKITNSGKWCSVES
jgi:hypothetical protein